MSLFLCFSQSWYDESAWIFYISFIPCVSTVFPRDGHVTLNITTKGLALGISTESQSSSEVEVIRYQVQVHLKLLGPSILPRLNGGTHHWGKQSQDRRSVIVLEAVEPLLLQVSICTKANSSWWPARGDIRLAPELPGKGSNDHICSAKQFKPFLP